MHHHVIAGFDGSAVSRAAVEWAAEEATRRDAGLTVVGCYGAPVVTDFGLATAPFLSAQSTRLRDRTQAELDALLDGVRHAHPALAVTACTIEGRPRRVLPAQAARADLLVIGTTGSGNEPDWSPGTVARSILHTSPCPVVLVPGRHDAAEPRTIVVAVDGTPRSAPALQFAVDEADRRGDMLTIVHAWRYPYAEGPSEAKDLVRVDAALALEEATRLARARGGAEVRDVLAEGRPAPAILAASEGADLLVVGTRADEGLGLLVLGSVAEAVIARAPCPVAVVRVTPS